MRRLRLTLVSLGAAVAVLAAAGTLHAAAGTQPTVVSVTPPELTVQPGQPVHVTLTGSGLATATDVLVDPPVPGRSFQSFNDSTLLVTLPPDTTPGAYTFRVVNSGGTSVPSPVLQLVAAAPQRPDRGGGGPTLPPFTFAPASPGAGAGAGAATATAAPAPPGHARSGVAPVLVAQVSIRDPLSNPLFVVALGVMAGGVAGVLWGDPGRIAVARRRTFGAQLVARPAQALHLARICLSCGRLHWILATRRDLWRAGHFCSATCFVAAQEAELSQEQSQRSAPSRLRGVTLYQELELQLEGVFAGEAARAGSPDVLFAEEEPEPAVSA